MSSAESSASPSCMSSSSFPSSMHSSGSKLVGLHEMEIFTIIQAHVDVQVHLPHISPIAIDVHSPHCIYVGEGLVHQYTFRCPSVRSFKVDIHPFTCGGA